MNNILEIVNLSYKYDEICAINNISLYLKQGEIVALIGANGAGKTTTFRCVSGLNANVSKNTIYFEGKDISGMSPHKVAKLGIAQCLEGRHVFPQLTVLENLIMGSYSSGFDQSILEYIYHLFPILKERSGQQASTLSGGEQQMLAIGRALMQKPKLLLLDEPSLGLAPKIINTIFEAIKKINKDECISILLVEQNCNVALDIANRAYVLETGTIIANGEPKDLLKNDFIRKSYLGIE